MATNERERTRRRPATNRDEVSNTCRGFGHHKRARTLVIAITLDEPSGGLNRH